MVDRHVASRAITATRADAPATVKGEVFVADKPRLWTEKRLANVLTQNFDIAPDGKRFVALMPATAPDDQRTQSHVIFLQNFA